MTTEKLGFEGFLSYLDDLLTPEKAICHTCGKEFETCTIISRNKGNDYCSIPCYNSDLALHGAIEVPKC